MKSLDELQFTISKELEQFYSQLKKSPAELYEPIAYILQLGGKRLRPALCLMANDLFEGKINDAIAPAVGIELFHNFTLLHDDIMDKAPLRRNQATVHEKWNADIAILSGDTMFVKSFQMVMNCPKRCLHDVLSTFSDTAIEVCEGQQLDMNFEKKQEVNIPDYIHMISLKTAVLLAGSLKIGAIIANAVEEDLHHIYEFGKNIGIAFQLQDDILDVYAEQSKFGKKIGGDIASNKKTFLILKALELADADTLATLKKWQGVAASEEENKIKSVTAIFNKLNIKECAEQEMQKYYQLALDHLHKISVAASRKVALTKFAESLMIREI